MARRLDRMTERLGLDPDQRTAMEALFKAHAAKRQAMRDEMQAGVKSILSEEQEANLSEMRENRREHRRERRHGMGKGKHGDNCQGADKAALVAPTTSRPVKL